MNVFKLFIILALVSLPIHAEAAPVISSASTSGGVLTVSVTSQGSNDLNSQEWVGTNIEAGTSGNAFIKTGWTVSAETATNAEVKYSNTQKHSGNNSLLSNFYIDDYDSIWIYDAGEQTEFFLSMWVYHDKIDDSARYQWKHFYIHSRLSISPVDGIKGPAWWWEDNSGLLDSWAASIFEIEIENVVDGFTQMAGDSYNPTDNWMKVEYYVKKATSAGASDGVFTWHRVGQAADDITVTDLITHSASSEPWRYILPSWYYGSLRDIEGEVYTGTRDMKMYFDDVYIKTGATARARVELGDNSVYANCTQTEVQELTQWGPVITANYNEGSLPATKYAFVVDANGDASNGVLVSSTAPALTCQADDTTTETSYAITATYTLEGARTVASCTWSNSLGGSGSLTATGGNISGTTTGLSTGDNVITITLTDSAAEEGVCNTTITRSAPSTATTGISATGSSSFSATGTTTME